MERTGSGGRVPQGGVSGVKPVQGRVVRGSFAVRSAEKAQAGFTLYRTSFKVCHLLWFRSLNCHYLVSRHTTLHAISLQRLVCVLIMHTVLHVYGLISTGVTIICVDGSIC